MHEFLQILNVAFYFALAYVAVVALVWLVTRDEPSLWTVRDVALRPAVFILSPFGVRFAPQASRPEVRAFLDRERKEEASATGGSISRFRSIRAAKEYLVGRIVAEAERQGVYLTEVERKMLCFSETDWTLPGIMDVNAEFERDYDESNYEEKIAGLVRNLLESATPDQQLEWDDAVLKLCDGDHYLLTLIDLGSNRQASPKLPKWLAAWLPVLKNEPARTRGDFARLIIAAFVFLLVMIGVAAIRSHFE